MTIESSLPQAIDSARLGQVRSEGKALLLDVRTAAEFESAHIPGSVNVPLALIEKHPEDLSAHINEETIIICRSGARAQRAQKLLAGVGVLDTSVLTGGIEAWKSAQGAIKAGPTRWDLERQVRLVAGSLVLSSIALSAVAPKAKYVAGAIGGGLSFAALSNTCAMGAALQKLPYNRQGEVSLKEAQVRLLQHND